MARSFGTSTDRLSNASVSVDSVGSVFVRLKPNWVHNDSAAHVLIWIGASDGLGPQFFKNSDNSAYMGWFFIADNRIVVAADATMFAPGVFANHLFTWDAAASEQFWYVNNTQKGSKLTAFNTTAFSLATLGNAPAGFFDSNLDGTLAECGIWNRVLTTSERAHLQLTGCPKSVPVGLTDHWHLCGNRSPEPNTMNTRSLTVTGTASAAHPATKIPGRHAMSGMSGFAGLGG